MRRPRSPHHGVVDGGEGQRLEETGPGPFSICVYILRALQMDFFCDLTYFSLVCVLGLISSAGVHRSCLESVAAMATGDSPRPQAKIEPRKLFFSGYQRCFKWLALLDCGSVRWTLLGFKGLYHIIYLSITDVWQVC